ncbi:MAG: SufS family cysteine desulfurase [Peptostreptococcaceae bacterium]|nr:SufS family cysteine desulfurase [Peptostreptococcaceae bacterium]
MNYRSLFPIFNQSGNHYMDTGATSQKPQQVIDAIANYYGNINGNPGRGSHRLAIESEQAVEKVRDKVKNFIGAKNKEEIIFTKNTTEAINLVAYSYGLDNFKEGDEILLGISNHHANIVPWQMVAEKTGAVIRYIYLDKDGQLDLEDYKSKLNNKTKLVSISAVVNATGVRQPFEEVIDLAKKQGAVTLLDTAQSIGHFRHQVDDIQTDFLAFSGHKIFAAMGVGVLYGKKELLNSMSPFLFGGDMIDYVEEQQTVFAELPHRLEAGTKDVGSIVSLGAAIDFIEEVGYEQLAKHEEKLLTLAYNELKKLDYIEIYHHENLKKAGVLAFNVKGVHSHDSAYILDGYGVMVRSGHHCAQPLMKYLGIASCCRASFSIYNDESDITALLEGLKKVKEVFSI